MIMGSENGVFYVYKYEFLNTSTLHTSVHIKMEMFPEINNWSLQITVWLHMRWLLYRRVRNRPKISCGNVEMKSKSVSLSLQMCGL